MTALYSSRGAESAMGEKADGSQCGATVETLWSYVEANSGKIITR